MKKSYSSSRLDLNLQFMSDYGTTSTTSNTCSTSSAVFNLDSDVTSSGNTDIVYDSSSIAVLKSTMSVSEKFFCALAVLMVLLTMAFIVLSIMVHKGTIQLPAMTQEIARTVISRVGAGVCITSLALLFLGLYSGYREKEIKRCKKKFDLT